VPTRCCYSIDTADAVFAVDDAWVRFAQGNGAPELTRQRVLGSSLWAHIAGSETREIYETLFDWVRSHRAKITVPMRCDSPERVRVMRLELSPAPRGGIQFECVLERQHTRPYFSLLDRLMQRSRQHLPVCSFCRRILAFGEWLEPETAATRLELLHTSFPPTPLESVCERCSSLTRGLAGGDALA